MKKILPLMLVMLLTARGKSEPIDTADSLAANFSQLKALRERFKTDRAKPDVNYATA